MTRVGQGPGQWLETHPEEQGGANPLWDYALHHYEAASEPCLALQDRLGADVNLLLFCCWAGSRGRILDAAAVGRLQALAEDWQTRAVKPLRQARRALKGEPDEDAQGLRERIKALELQAERIEQDRLVAALPVEEVQALPDSERAAAAAANLRRYLARMRVEEDAPERDLLVGLLTACFAGLEAAEAKRLLKG